MKEQQIKKLNELFFDCENKLNDHAAAMAVADAIVELTKDPSFYETKALNYKNGDRVEKNLDCAIECLNKAIERGDNLAHALLGKIYEEKKDYIKAYEQYLAAYNAGYNKENGFGDSLKKANEMKKLIK